LGEAEERAPSVQRHQPSEGGRPRKYDRVKIAYVFARIADENGLPATQAECVRLAYEEMKAWPPDEVPEDTTMRNFVRELYNWLKGVGWNPGPSQKP
jgi:hypothetical protein